MGQNVVERAVPHLTPSPVVVIFLKRKSLPGPERQAALAATVLFKTQEKKPSAACSMVGRYAPHGSQNYRYGALLSALLRRMSGLTRTDGTWPSARQREQTAPCTHGARCGTATTNDQAACARGPGHRHRRAQIFRGGGRCATSEMRQTEGLLRQRVRPKAHEQAARQQVAALPRGL